MQLDTAGLKLEGSVFVTGGAGFLGRAIIRRAQREKWPCSFTVYSRDEEKQWKLQNQYGTSVRCHLGDVRDYNSLITLMSGHDIVIHAAAIKFIPEAERNVWECARVNIDGSRNVARAAAWCNVKQAVAISTDKACLPANTYGTTKMLMERLWAEAARWMEPTQYSCVRYGNVVGSTGSIVPVFRHQLSRYGRVSVTDRRMTRFWLSVDQAIDMILIALARGGRYPGGVFVPRAPAMKVIDLARVVAGEASINETGIRPGEKLDEDLISMQESPRALKQDDHFVVQPTHTDNQYTWDYNSARPASWIEPAEMAAMIADAEDV